jgi:hypothetical protein
MTYRKNNCRPSRVIKDNSAVGISMDMATLRLLAKMVADEMEERENERRGFMPTDRSTTLNNDIPTLFN